MVKEFYSKILRNLLSPGAEIAMLQDTANEGYSTAHIAGTANQVDKTLDVLHKMIESGKKAAEVRI